MSALDIIQLGILGACAVALFQLWRGGNSAPSRRRSHSTYRSEWLPEPKPKVAPTEVQLGRDAMMDEWVLTTRDLAHAAGLRDDEFDPASPEFLIAITDALPEAVVERIKAAAQERVKARAEAFLDAYRRTPKYIEAKALIESRMSGVLQ